MATRKKAAKKTAKKRATKKTAIKVKTPPKKEVGRPSKYDPKFCEEIVTFFNQEPYEQLTRTITRKDGSVVEEEVRVATPLPTLADYATKIGVHRDSIHEWSKNYPEFSDAIKRAKDCQERILVTNGLMGLYNPSFAIFTAKNVIGWKDRHDVVNVNKTQEEWVEELGDLD